MRKAFLLAAVIALIVGPLMSSAVAQSFGFQKPGMKAAPPAPKAAPTVIHHQATAGVEVSPVRVAPILGYQNGQPIIGAWRTYNKPTTAGVPYPSGVMIDGYEGDTHYGNADVCDADGTTNTPANGTLSGGVDPACNFGGAFTGACGDGDTIRWFLGFTPGDNTPAWSGYLAAFGSFAAGAPSVSTAQSFAWSQSFGSDSAPPCGTYNNTLVIINVYDNSVASLIDVNAQGDIDATALGGGFVDGVILDFGALASSTAGYFFSSVNLTGGDPEVYLGVVGGTEVGLPEDGALEVRLVNGDGLGGATTEPLGQMMLWDNKDDTTQGNWREGYFLLDGNHDGSISGGNTNTNDCAANDGEYLYTAGNDQFAQFDDASWPGGCPPVLMPMIGLFGEPADLTFVNATSEQVLLGTPASGQLSDTFTSDDQRQCTLTGHAFSPFLPSLIWQFDSTLPTDSPSALSVRVEAQVNDFGIEQSIQCHNYDTGSLETVDTRAASRNVDQIVEVELTGDVTRFVEAGTGNVRMRVNYKSDGTGFFAQWQACIDELAWGYSN